MDWRVLVVPPSLPAGHTFVTQAVVGYPDTTTRWPASIPILLR